MKYKDKLLLSRLSWWAPAARHTTLHDRRRRPCAKHCGLNWQESELRHSDTATQHMCCTFWTHSDVAHLSKYGCCKKHPRLHNFFAWPWLFVAPRSTPCWWSHLQQSPIPRIWSLKINKMRQPKLEWNMWNPKGTVCSTPSCWQFFQKIGQGYSIHICTKSLSSLLKQQSDVQDKTKSCDGANLPASKRLGSL